MRIIYFKGKYFNPSLWSKKDKAKIISVYERSLGLFSGIAFSCHINLSEYDIHMMNKKLLLETIKSKK